MSIEVDSSPHRMTSAFKSSAAFLTYSRMSSITGRSPPVPADHDSFVVLLATSATPKALASISSAFCFVFVNVVP